jgi:serine/threonine protein kinase
MCDAGNTKMITVGKGTFGSVLFCQRKCVLSKAIPEVSSLEEARSPEERSETCYCVKRIAKTKQSWIMRKQIEREIQIHSRLDHFAIIKFLGYYESEKNIDFALEFAMYSDLFHFINTYRPQNGLPVLLSHREASNYIDQILQAMNYLHQRYIFHRDIKMENILVTSIDGDENRREQKLQLKLCDFGWAIHCSSSNELWRTTFCGTPEYLAPELVESYHITRTKFSTEDRPKLLNGRGNFQRLRSKCPKYDVRFPDIWAVGVLTYELLRGANPFNSHSIGEEKKAMKGDDQTSTTTSKEVIFDKIRKVDDFIEVKVTQDSREERLMCNFVAKLTRKNPEQRISFENALGQKWITSFK